MAKIKPFKAVRPVPDKVHLVASRSYVSYSPEKLAEKLDSNPFSFIHIINPDYNEPVKIKGGTAEMFEKVKDKYAFFKNEGILIKEDADCIYVYRQTTPENSYIGIITGVSSEDYKNKVIKIHESTIKRREDLFSEYLDIVDFNAEPVLLSYPKNDACTTILQEATQQNHLYDFTTSDSIRHTLWKVSDEESILKFQNEFNKIDRLYIADGHHRSASSAKIAELRNNKNPNANSNWFLAMLTPEDSMKIFGFHRILRGFSKSEADQIIKNISQDFKLEPILGNQYSPKNGHVHMYYFGTGWMSLRLKEVESDSPKDHIDAEKLSAQILLPHAGISDLKNDYRVKFIPDTSDLNKIEKEVSDNNEILFLLAPVTFNELKAVADADENMPPKSTYIEPKLRSGLTIFEMSDE